MFFVDLYKNNNLIVHAPFENKNTAIRYFNYVSDGNNPFVTSVDRIEILDENVCLFDYEV